MYIYMYMYIYIHIHIYTHTHTHTRTGDPNSAINYDTFLQGDEIIYTDLKMYSSKPKPY